MGLHTCGALTNVIQHFKATEQYFIVFLFIMLNKVVLTFESLDSVTIQMKATEHYFPVVLFIMRYKVVLILNIWMKSYSITIQMKAIEQYFLVFLLIVHTR